MCQISRVFFNYGRNNECKTYFFVLGRSENVELKKIVAQKWYFRWPSFNLCMFGTNQKYQLTGNVMVELDEVTEVDLRIAIISVCVWWKLLVCSTKYRLCTKHWFAFTITLPHTCSHGLHLTLSTAPMSSAWFSYQCNLSNSYFLHVALVR